MAVDPVVNGLVIALSGMSIPEGSAERVRAEIVVPHLELARFLTGLEGALGDITGATVKGAQGEAMQAYAQAVSQLTSGDGSDYVKGLKDTALQLADAGNEFAYQLDYTNMMIVEQVVLFFAELALIAVLEVFNPIQAAFEKLALDTFFRELFTTELTQFLARTAAQTASIMTMNVVLAAALDGLTRWVLAAQGKHTAHGDEYRDQSLKFGAIQGAVSSLVPFVMGPIGKGIGKLPFFGPKAVKNIQQIIGESLHGPTATPARSGGKTAAAGGDSALVGGGKAALGGQKAAVGGGKAALGGKQALLGPAKSFDEKALRELWNDPLNRELVSGNWFGREIGRLTVPMAVRLQNEVVGRAGRQTFRNAVGDQFARAFGERLGWRQAREAGRLWADTFMAHAGRGPKALGRELEGTLHWMPSGMGGVRNALSHELAGALPSPSWMKFVRAFPEAGLQAGAMNLSEGFFNLNEQGKFTTSWMTTAGGAGAAFGSAVGHIGAAKLGHWIKGRLGFDLPQHKPSLTGLDLTQINTTPSGDGPAGGGGALPGDGGSPQGGSTPAPSYRSTPRPGETTLPPGNMLPTTGQNTTTPLSPAPQFPRSGQVRLDIPERLTVGHTTPDPARTSGDQSSSPAPRLATESGAGRPPLGAGQRARLEESLHRWQAPEELTRHDTDDADRARLILERPAAAFQAMEHLRQLAGEAGITPAEQRRLLAGADRAVARRDWPQAAAGLTAFRDHIRTTLDTGPAAPHTPASGTPTPEHAAGTHTTAAPDHPIRTHSQDSQAHSPTIPATQPAPAPPATAELFSPRTNASAYPERHNRPSGDTQQHYRPVAQQPPQPSSRNPDTSIPAQKTDTVVVVGQITTPYDAWKILTREHPDIAEDLLATTARMIPDAWGESHDAIQRTYARLTPDEKTQNIRTQALIISNILLDGRHTTGLLDAGIAPVSEEDLEEALEIWFNGHSETDQEPHSFPPKRSDKVRIPGKAGVAGSSNAVASAPRTIHIGKILDSARERGRNRFSVRSIEILQPHAHVEKRGDKWFLAWSLNSALRTQEIEDFFSSANNAEVAVPKRIKQFFRSSVRQGYIDNDANLQLRNYLEARGFPLRFENKGGKRFFFLQPLPNESPLDMVIRVGFESGPSTASGRPSGETAAGPESAAPTPHGTIAINVDEAMDVDESVESPTGADKGMDESMDSDEAMGQARTADGPTGGVEVVGRARLEHIARDVSRDQDHVVTSVADGHEAPVGLSEEDVRRLADEFMEDDANWLALLGGWNQQKLLRVWADANRLFSRAADRLTAELVNAADASGRMAIGRQLNRSDDDIRAEIRRRTLDHYGLNPIQDQAEVALIWKAATSSDNPSFEGKLAEACRTLRAHRSQSSPQPSLSTPSVQVYAARTEDVMESGINRYLSIPELTKNLTDRHIAILTGRSITDHRAHRRTPPESSIPPQSRIAANLETARENLSAAPVDLVPVRKEPLFETAPSAEAEEINYEISVDGTIEELTQTGRVLPIPSSVTGDSNHERFDPGLRRVISSTDESSEETEDIKKGWKVNGEDAAARYDLKKQLRTVSGSRQTRILDVLQLRQIISVLREKIQSKNDRKGVTDPEPVETCWRNVLELKEHLFPEGIVSPFVNDDSRVGVRPLETQIAHAGWKSVQSWEEVVSALEFIGPGSAAFILTRRSHGLGHAWVAYALPRRAEMEELVPNRKSIRNQGKSSVEVVWIDPSRGDGKELISIPSLEMSGDDNTRDRDAVMGGLLSVFPPPFDARAVIVDSSARAVIDPFPFQGSTSTVNALTDPARDRRYGAIGLEAELQYPIARRDGSRFSYGEELAIHPATGSKIVVDFASFYRNRQNGALCIESNPSENSAFYREMHAVPEIVMSPMAAVPGDTGRMSQNDGILLYRRTIEILKSKKSLQHLREVGWHLIGSGVNSYITDTVSDGEDRALVHFTVGAPAAGLTSLLNSLNVYDNLSEYSPLVNTGRSFADRVTARYIAHQLPELNAARITPGSVSFMHGFPGVEELHGYIWLVFNHVSGRFISDEYDGGGLSKNALPIVSRTDFNELHATLSDPVKRFMQNSVGFISETFVREVNRVVNWHEAAAGSRSDGSEFDLAQKISSDSTYGDYLMTGILGNKHRRNVSQWEALGMQGYNTPDTNQGRINYPLALLELRFFSTDPSVMASRNFRQVFTSEQFEEALGILESASTSSYQRRSRFSEVIPSHRDRLLAMKIYGDPLIGKLSDAFDHLDGLFRPSGKGKHIPIITGMQRELISHDLTLHVLTGRPIGKHVLKPLYFVLNLITEQAVRGMPEDWANVYGRARVATDEAIRGILTRMKP
nr:hypothetical protein StreXyl84_73370 [Streptomyces sp. Xyl84]